MRIRTGYGRGCGLDAPGAGVQVVLTPTFWVFDLSLPTMHPILSLMKACAVLQQSSGVDDHAQADNGLNFQTCQVCLVGADGNAILRRVVPFHDPFAAEQEALEICKAS